MLIVESYSVSAVHAPQSPRGFEVDIYIDSTKYFHPLGIYLGAINFMYVFVQKPWDEPFVGGFRTWAPGFDVEVDIESQQGPTSVLQPETRHIVMALVDVIAKVTKENKPCKVLATLSIHRRLVANLAIQNWSGPELGTGGTSTNATVSIAPGIGAGISATRRSGQYTNQEDPELSVSYTFHDVRADGQDVSIRHVEKLVKAANLMLDFHCHAGLLGHCSAI